MYFILLYFKYKYFVHNENSYLITSYNQDKIILLVLYNIKNFNFKKSIKFRLDNFNRNLTFFVKYYFVFFLYMYVT